MLLNSPSVEVVPSPTAADVSDDDAVSAAGVSAGCALDASLMECVETLGVVPSIGIGIIITVVLLLL